MLPSVWQFDEAEIAAARAVLEAEVEVVRSAMGHANLDEEHPRAWAEMQVSGRTCELVCTRVRVTFHRRVEL